MPTRVWPAISLGAIAPLFLAWAVYQQSELTNTISATDRITDEIDIGLAVNPESHSQSHAEAERSRVTSEALSKCIEREGAPGNIRNLQLLTAPCVNRQLKQEGRDWRWERLTGKFIRP